MKNTRKNSLKLSKAKTLKRKSGLNLGQLRNFNIAVSLLLALQAIALFLLSNKSRGTEPVTTGYLTDDTLASSLAGQPVMVPATDVLFDINLTYMLAATLLVGSVAALLMASRFRKNYEANLKKGFNRYRWSGYGILFGLVLVTIGLLSGLSDVAALLAVFTLGITASLLASHSEESRTSKQTAPTLIRLGILSASVAWLMLLIYAVGSIIHGTGLPMFVWWIYGSIFILFLAIAVLPRFHKNRAGDAYLRMERSYILLSFLALSALAWQVFAGTLR